MRIVAILVLAAGIAGAGQSLTQDFDQAVGALARRDYTAAEAGFQTVLASSPDHVDTLLNLGVVYSRTGRVPQAIATYRRVLGYTGALLNLGLAYMRQKLYRDALNVFQSLLQVDASSLPARDIRLLFPLCDGYLKQNQTDEDRKKLDSFLAALPRAAAHLVLCKLYYGRDQFEDAERQCRKALAIEPEVAGGHLELARVLVGEHSPKASGELAAAMREKPNDPEALYDLGVALLQVGRTADGVRYLERAKDLNPEFWGSYFQLGKAWLQANKAELSVPLLRRAVELNDTSFSLYYHLGRALLATGRTEEAGRAMQRARELMALELEKETKALGKQ